MNSNQIIDVTVILKNNKALPYRIYFDFIMSYLEDAQKTFLDDLFDTYQSLLKYKNSRGKEFKSKILRYLLYKGTRTPDGKIGFDKETLEQFENYKKVHLDTPNINPSKESKTHDFNTHINLFVNKKTENSNFIQKGEIDRIEQRMPLFPILQASGVNLLEWRTESRKRTHNNVEVDSIDIPEDNQIKRQRLSPPPTNPPLFSQRMVSPPLEVKSFREPFHAHPTLNYQEVSPQVLLPQRISQPGANYHISSFLGFNTQPQVVNYPGFNPPKGSFAPILPPQAGYSQLNSTRPINIPQTVRVSHSNPARGQQNNGVQ